MPVSHGDVGKRWARAREPIRARAQVTRPRSQAWMRCDSGGLLEGGNESSVAVGARERACSGVRDSRRAGVNSQQRRGMRKSVKPPGDSKARLARSMQACCSLAVVQRTSRAEGGASWRRVRGVIRGQRETRSTAATMIVCCRWTSRQRHRRGRDGEMEGGGVVVVGIDEAGDGLGIWHGCPHYCPLSTPGRFSGALVAGGGETRRGLSVAAGQDSRECSLH